MSKENVTVSSTEQSNEPAPATAKSSKSTKVVIVVLLLVVCVLAVLLAVSVFSPEDETEELTDGRTTFVSKENVEEIKEELSQPVEDAYYTVSMTVDWEFYDGKSVSTNAYVENVTANKRTVYYDVFLADTGELVYSSPYLPVGERMQEIALDKELPKGDYPAIITYYLVDDDHQVITDVSVAITLHILN